MKAHRYRLAVVASAILWIGCDNSSDPADSAVPDQTDGRMTITNDESVLSERFDATEADVDIDTTLAKTSRPAAFRLRLLGTVNPPTVSGQKLQATSVTLDDDYAIVSYAMAGSQALGAIDVVDVRIGSNARIRSSARFTDTDVNAARYSANFVYLAEATTAPAFDPLTAVVERISCSNGKLNLTGSQRRGLASYVATSTHISGTTLYVTTGNTGYLYRFNASTLAVIDSTSLADARWVDTDNSRIVVVQGTPGRLSVHNKTSGAVSSSYTFAGATIAESKSTVQVIGGKALVAAGDGGVKLVELSSGTTVGSLARVTVSGLDPSVTVTNAVSGAGRYVYSSNGEAGVYVARASTDLENSTGTSSISLTSLGKIKFSNLQSANHIATNGNTLVVAAGLGGVKIVRVSF